MYHIFCKIKQITDTFYLIVDHFSILLIITNQMYNVYILQNLVGK